MLDIDTFTYFSMVVVTPTLTYIFNYSIIDQTTGRLFDYVFIDRMSLVSRLTFRNTI